MVTVVFSSKIINNSTINTRVNEAVAEDKSAVDCGPEAVCNNNLDNCNRMCLQVKCCALNVIFSLSSSNQTIYIKNCTGLSSKGTDYNYCKCYILQNYKDGASSVEYLNGSAETKDAYCGLSLACVCLRMIVLSSSISAQLHTLSLINENNSAFSSLVPIHQTQSTQMSTALGGFQQILHIDHHILKSIVGLDSKSGPGDNDSSIILDSNKLCICTPVSLGRTHSFCIVAEEFLRCILRFQIDQTICIYHTLSI